MKQHAEGLEQNGMGLISLDPRTKLFVLLVISTTCAVGYRGPILMVKPYFIAAPFILLALDGKVMAAVKVGCLYWLTAYWHVWLFFLPPSGAIRDIVRFVMAILSSFMPSLVMGYYVISTTKVSEFVAAMQSLRISQKIIIPFVVLFRFFPTIAEEYGAIQDAMRMRGIGIASGPIAMLEYRMVPLMISLVKIGDDLSAAAATRALDGSSKRTNLCRLHFGLMDAILCFAALIVLVMLAFYSG